MRAFKIGLYLSAVLLLQTVILPRFNFLGVVPDLVLVTVVFYAVLLERTPATLLSALAGFLQDILACPFYLNTIIKTITGAAANTFRERFMGDEYTLIAGLVALFTPLSVLAEGLTLHFIFHREFSLWYFIFRLVAETVYNLILVPLLYPLVRVTLDE
ncbi:MAG: rod shape-determining protein MreD [Candidatus Margulisiibacteriota bacterium]